jgi:hypothetical protein
MALFISDRAANIVLVFIGARELQIGSIIGKEERCWTAQQLKAQGSPVLHLVELLTGDLVL